MDSGKTAQIQVSEAVESGERGGDSLPDEDQRPSPSAIYPADCPIPQEGQVAAPSADRFRISTRVQQAGHPSAGIYLRGHLYKPRKSTPWTWRGRHLEKLLPTHLPSVNATNPGGIVNRAISLSIRYSTVDCDERKDFTAISKPSTNSSSLSQCVGKVSELCVIPCTVARHQSTTPISSMRIRASISTSPTFPKTRTDQGRNSTRSTATRICWYTVTSTNERRRPETI